MGQKRTTKLREYEGVVRIKRKKSERKTESDRGGRMEEVKAKKESKQENWRENGKGEDGREREREIGNEGYRHTGNVLTATCRRQTS